MTDKKEIQSLYKSELGKTRPYQRTRAPEAEPFWNGCKEQRLMLPRCRRCSHFHFYPRRFCPMCDSAEIDWYAASGKGSVYSFAIVRQPLEKAFSELLPYVIAIIELEEGVRLLSQVVEGNPEDVFCGMHVRVRFRSVSDDLTIPVFEPDPDLR